MIKVLHYFHHHNNSSLCTELEYYQILRLQLVSWIGVLRCIQSDSLHPAIQAMHQYYQAQHYHTSSIRNSADITTIIIILTLQNIEIVKSFLYYPTDKIKHVLSTTTTKNNNQQQ